MLKLLVVLAIVTAPFLEDHRMAVMRVEAAKKILPSPKDWLIRAACWVGLKLKSCNAEDTKPLLSDAESVREKRNSFYDSAPSSPAESVPFFSFNNGYPRGFQKDIEAMRSKTRTKSDKDASKRNKEGTHVFDEKTDPLSSWPHGPNSDKSSNSLLQPKHYENALPHGTSLKETSGQKLPIVELAHFKLIHQMNHDFYLVELLKTEEKFSLKLYNIHHNLQRNSESFSIIMHELHMSKALRDLKHVVSLQFAFQKEYALFLVYNNPGVAIPTKFENDHSIRDVVGYLILAVYEMHEKGFTHGNIDKDNVRLVKDQHGNFRIYLRDFSQTVQHKQYSTTKWDWTNDDALQISQILHVMYVGGGGPEGDWSVMNPMFDLENDLANIKSSRRKGKSILEVAMKSEFLKTFFDKRSKNPFRDSSEDSFNIELPELEETANNLSPHYFDKMCSKIVETNTRTALRPLNVAEAKEFSKAYFVDPTHGRYFRTKHVYDCLESYGSHRVHPVENVQPMQPKYSMHSMQSNPFEQSEHSEHSDPSDLSEPSVSLSQSLEMDYPPESLLRMQQNEKSSWARIKSVPLFFLGKSSGHLTPKQITRPKSMSDQSIADLSEPESDNNRQNRNLPKSFSSDVYEQLKHKEIVFGCEVSVTFYCVFHESTQSEKDKKDYKHRFKVYKANGIDKIELINQLKLGEKKLILDFLDPDTIKYKKHFLLKPRKAWSKHLDAHVCVIDSTLEKQHLLSTSVTDEEKLKSLFRLRSVADKVATTISKVHHLTPDKITVACTGHGAVIATIFCDGINQPNQMIDKLFAFEPKESKESKKYYIQKKHAKFVEIFWNEETRATAHVKVFFTIWPPETPPTELFAVTAAKEAVVRYNLRSKETEVFALDENGKAEKAEHRSYSKNSYHKYVELGLFGTDSQEHHEFDIYIGRAKYNPIGSAFFKYYQSQDPTITPEEDEN